MEVRTFPVVSDDFDIHPHPRSYLLIYVLQIITCIPPTPGYGTLLYLSGFALGFPRAFVPTYLGALTGCLLCFYSARQLSETGRNRVKRSIPNWHAFERVVEEGGWKLVLLVRISPYPASFLNLVFAMTSVDPFVYATATAVSLLKLLLYTYIGSTIHDIAFEEPSTARTVGMVLGALFGISAFILVGWRVRKVLRDTGGGLLEEGEDEDLEEGLIDDEIGDGILDDINGVLADEDGRRSPLRI